MSRRGDNIRKRKDGRWEGRFCKGRDDKGRIKYGSVYGKSYNEVKERLGFQITNKRDNPISRSNIRFSEVLELWLRNNIVHQKGSTTNRYRNLIETHISPKLGSYDVKEISSNMVNDFLAQKLSNGRIDGKGGLSNSYVKSMMIVIKSALKYASDEGMCQPLKSSIDKPADVKSRIGILNTNDQMKLEKYLINDINETAIGILLSLHAGLRIGEVCALTWSDIDLNNRIIFIRHTVARIRVTDEVNQSSTQLVIDSPKTKSSLREIPISKFLYNVLLQEKVSSRSDFVVSDRASFISPRTYDYRYHKILEQCNVTSINFHALRHTFATRCIEAGVDVKSLSEILGHSNVSITLNTYVHSSMEFKRNQIEKLSVPSIS